MKQPPKPPAKLPPRGGPMSPPPARPSQPPGIATPPAKPQAPPPLAARSLAATPRRPEAARPAPARPAVQAPRPGAPIQGAAPPRPGSPQGIARTAQVAAAGATGTVGGVIEAVRLMDGVLVEENQVLRRHDARAAAALQERKLAATRLYHERMRALAKDAEAARTMPDEQRAQLAAMARSLDEHVRENAILLKATMDSIDRLFAAINTAAQQKAKREVSYSRKGVVAPSSMPGAASVAFNRTV